MKFVSFVFLLILVAFGISFAILNASDVSLNYYVGSRNISLSLLLVLTLAIGALTGFIVAVPTLFRYKCANRKLKNQVKTVEKELANLRSLPLRNSH